MGHPSTYGAPFHLWGTFPFLGRLSSPQPFLATALARHSLSSPQPFLATAPQPSPAHLTLNPGAVRHKLEPDLDPDLDPELGPKAAHNHGYNPNLLAHPERISNLAPHLNLANKVYHRNANQR